MSDSGDSRYVRAVTSVWLHTHTGKVTLFTFQFSFLLHHKTRSANEVVDRDSDECWKPEATVRCEQRDMWTSQKVDRQSVWQCKEKTTKKKRIWETALKPDVTREPEASPYTAATQPCCSGSWCRAAAPAEGHFLRRSLAVAACWHRHTRTSWPSKSAAGSPSAGDSVYRGTWCGCTYRGGGRTDS